MFWQKFEYLCELHEKKPRVVGKELNISPASITSWKKGLIPNLEKLLIIAEYFSVSVDYLISEEISIKPSHKKEAMNFINLSALPQRWASLPPGYKLTNKEMLELLQFVNCSLRFVSNSNIVQYEPYKTNLPNTSSDNKALFDILDIMDCCADTLEFRDLQIQLSRIALYHLKNKGIGAFELSQYKQLSQEKLNFLYTGTKNRDDSLNYGLNYSDLSLIRHRTGLSYIYMFTGKE